MTGYTLSPWSINVRGNKFIVGNNINPNIKQGGARYVKVINKFLPKHDLTFSTVFFAEGSDGISYFLALTKDKFPPEMKMVSNTLIDNIQISVINFSQTFVSNSKKQTFGFTIKFGQSWLFLPEGVKVNPTAGQEQQKKYAIQAEQYN